MLFLFYLHRLMKSFINEMKFKVRFTFNRLPVKLQHRASQLADEHSLGQLLFPRHDTICTTGTIIPANTTLR